MKTLNLLILISITLLVNACHNSETEARNFYNAAIKEYQKSTPDYKKALVLLDEAIILNPKNTLAKKMRIQFLIRKKDYKAAFGFAKMLIVEGMTGPETSILFASLAIAANVDLTKEEIDFYTLVKDQSLNKKNAKAITNLIIAHLLVGNSEEASKQHTKLQEISKNKVTLETAAKIFSLNGPRAVANYVLEMNI